MGKKPLACLFMPKVLCSNRKVERFGVMDRCERCNHYEDFLREMDEEDEKIMDEIEAWRRFKPYG